MGLTTYCTLYQPEDFFDVYNSYYIRAVVKRKQQRAQNQAARLQLRPGLLRKKGTQMYVKPHKSRNGRRPDKPDDGYLVNGIFPSFSCSKR